MEIFKKYLCQRQLVSLRHLRLLKEDSNAKPRPLSPPQTPSQVRVVLRSCYSSRRSFPLLTGTAGSFEFSPGEDFGKKRIRVDLSRL